MTMRHCPISKTSAIAALRVLCYSIAFIFALSTAGAQQSVLKDSRDKIVLADVIVDIDSVTRGAIGLLAESQAEYLLRNQNPDGSINYLILDDCSVAAERNNAIRQWLATLALAEFAEQSKNPSWCEVAASHRDFLLAQMLVEHDGLTSLRLRERIKLGTLAIACMALDALERQGFSSNRVTSADLLRSVIAMQDANGDFRTFLDPPERDDQQLFYPGEALTCIAYVAPRQGHEIQERLEAASLRGIRRYRERWESGELKNPAFVPWHIQAIALHLDSFEPDTNTTTWLTEYLFELADWLVGYQQTIDAPSAIEYGRFYDPMRPDFGPPHASSTGVYLEGLSLAAKVAIRSDHVRTERYLGSIRTGFRHQMQLQTSLAKTRSPLEPCALLINGIPNSTNDHTVRIDNAAHCLRSTVQYNSAIVVIHVE